MSTNTDPTDFDTVSTTDRSPTGFMLDDPDFLHREQFHACDIKINLHIQSMPEHTVMHHLRQAFEHLAPILDNDDSILISVESSTRTKFDNCPF